MKTLFKEANIISPGVDMMGSVVVDNGIIEGIIPQGEALPEADTVVDCGRQRLLPGFIDVHAHGRSGVDYTDVEHGDSAIRRITEDKRRLDGVTSVLVTTLTLSRDHLRECCRQAAAVMNDTNAKGARILGMHLEGPYFPAACAGAQNPAFLRNPDIDEVLELNDICRVRKVTYAVELPGSLPFAEAMRKAGIVPSCGHSAATYEQVLEAYNHGLRDFSHFCNVVTPMHHLAFGAVGAGLDIDDFNCEIIGDKFHIQPPMLRFIIKVKGTEHLQLITDAMRASGLGDGPSSLGGLDVIVKDGVARLAENGRIAGSTLLYNIGLKNLVEVTGKPLKDVVRMTSLNQALGLGITDLGRIAPGYRADMVLMKEDYSVVNTFVDGR